jgi:Zn ribbon nucleic-acid-binding protein
MLPSERVRISERSRHRRRTILVWRCPNCNAVYDALPRMTERGYPNVEGCPACGWFGSLRRSRIAD